MIGKSQLRKREKEVASSWIIERKRLFSPLSGGVGATPPRVAIDIDPSCAPGVSTLWEKFRDRTTSNTFLNNQKNDH